MTKLSLHWFSADLPDESELPEPGGGIGTELRVERCDRSWTDCWLDVMRRAQCEAYLMPRFVAVHDYGARVTAGAGVVRRSEAPALIIHDNPTVAGRGSLEEFRRLWFDVLNAALEFKTVGIPADIWCSEDPPGTSNSWTALCLALRDVRST